MAESVLQIEELNLSIGSLQLTKSFSLDIKKGERVGITGPSGCGKSSLLKLLIDSAVIEGASFTKLLINKETKISYIPQSKGLLPWFSLKKNLNVFETNSNLTLETTKAFNLNQNLASFPHQLSGGEYQRSIVAASIINNPKLYLADEPLTELDISSKWKLLNFWSDKIKSSDCSLMLVSHDIETLLYMCDRIIILTDKPFRIKRHFSVNEPHPRRLDFLISEKFIDSKKKLLDIISTNYFQINKDYETADKAGAGGLFQIISLIDVHGNDISNKIDVGIFFRDDNEVKAYLSGILDLDYDSIDIEDI